MNSTAFLRGFAILLIAAAAVVAQTGGTFDLSHNVIAGGGGTSSAGNFRVDGTVGQAAAGTVSTGPNFSVTGGFWTADPLVPTAAHVNVSGRVLTSAGIGIRGAMLYLASPDGTTRIATSSSFGYYTFNDVEVGQSYVVTVTSRRFVFVQPVRIVSVQDELTGLDFTAQ